MSASADAGSESPTATGAGSDAESRETGPDRDVDNDVVAGLSVLVVGTFGGGGVHQYIDGQVARLPDELSVTTHDMGMPPTDSGFTRPLEGVLLGALAALRFPFRSRPDVTHVHTSHRFSFYRAAVYVLFAKYIWRSAVVVHVHGSSFDEFVTTDSRAVAALQDRVFAAADEVIVLSEYWRDVVARRTDRGKVRVLPNAVDPEEYPDDAAGDDGTPHVVFVSNLVERKGVSELVGAVEAVLERRDGIRVSIAGDGPLADEVERLSAEHDEVSYLGYVSEQRKRELLGEGSIFVLPTYAEGLPIAMLEGMAGGNAVVSTAVGSIPEVIDRDTGLLVDPGDVAGLADALETLATDAERRRAMGANCRTAVEDRYSWDRVIDELVSAYHSYAR
ncbi:glycosyltransferase family 4 protein [Halosimplex pelagicum]|uniref:Glycosyltransferase family 4 protein n=1 Tax=Halosimplex pelagicum TaxID=869886 RepID=A0A7D5T8Q1_9EURY|nr:glycosyltransferase family 4 protein [Halosimplex pelagicum]QLH81190.1 glycosyltransferase family 4 protein [Halosimplex pelagicum]